MAGDLDDLEPIRREQDWPCATCRHPRRVHALGLAAPDLCLGVNAGDPPPACRCVLYRRDWSAPPPP